MSGNATVSYSSAADAIDDGDVEKLAYLFERFPALREIDVPDVGASWLHYAAAFGGKEALDYLIAQGFDKDTPRAEDGMRPIFSACQRGREDNVAYFLSMRAGLDTSVSGTNPLFAAVLGKSTKVVRLLLDHGIDASVRYMGGWKNMDALAFASMWGEMEIADMIADHLAGGNSERKRALLDEARAIAEANVEPVPPHGCCPDLSKDDD